MKNTSIKNKRQYPKYVYTKLNSDFLFQSAHTFQDKLTKSSIELLNTLVFYSHIYPCIFPSQTTLAKAIGCCRQTINRLIGELESLGLIKRLYRRKTWIISLCAWLNSQKARWALKSLFPALAIGIDYGIPYISETYINHCMSKELICSSVKENATVTSSNIKEKEIYIKKEEEKRELKINFMKPKPKQDPKYSVRDINHFVYLYHQCSPSEKKSIIAMLPEDDPLLTHLLFSSYEKEEKSCAKKEDGSDNPFKYI